MPNRCLAWSGPRRSSSLRKIRSSKGNFLRSRLDLGHQVLTVTIEYYGHLNDPVYGVLGDHDTIQMVPGLEAMGIRMLLNECAVIVRGDQQMYLAGIDDAHYFRVDNIEKAALQVPHGEFSILLSHTPEIYRQAAHADFDLL